MSTAVRSDVKATLERITPQMAATYLEQNSCNRPIKPNFLKQLTGEMPTWKVNGDTIRFSSSGRLLDGQHRLMACVASGVAFWCYVIRGLDESVFDTIDQGKPRTARDVMYIAGEKNPNELARTLTLVWRLQNNALGEAQYPNNRQRNEVLKATPQIRASVEYAVGLDVNGIIPASLVSFLHFVGTQVDAGKTYEFLESLASGAELSAQSPILHFREAAIEMKNARKKPPYRSDMLVALAIKALQIYIDGRLVLRYLQHKKNDRFPVLTKPPLEGK